MTPPPETKIFIKNLPADIKEKEVSYIFSKYGAVQSSDVIMWPGTPSLSSTGSLLPYDLTLSSRQKIEWQACAFITYSTADAANTAIRALNGVYKPRSSSKEPLTVCLARTGALPEPVELGRPPAPAPVEQGASSSFSTSAALAAPVSSSFSSAPPAASATANYVAEKTRCKLFVGNLKSDCPRPNLTVVFGEWGRVVNVHVMSGKSKFGSACAFVEMATPGEAEVALKAMHHKLDPRIGSGTAPITVTYFQSQSSGKAATTVAGSGSSGFSRYTPYQL
eukprot:TRINITY_DN16176_c0_g1_i2.p1 TRINITY_DN16176_c0_g1~~TRINITY_DN16176_c0_g1_i2.p1  ORF type:complete len:279 (+),score=42.26 TRINITY_DN16176_c0_g1_i2:71-907(+)